jgi:hypothetical protein
MIMNDDEFVSGGLIKAELETDLAHIEFEHDLT